MTVNFRSVLEIQASLADPKLEQIMWSNSSFCGEPVSASKSDAENIRYCGTWYSPSIFWIGNILGLPFGRLSKTQSRSGNSTWMRFRPSFCVGMLLNLNPSTFVLSAFSTLLLWKISANFSHSLVEKTSHTLLPTMNSYTEQIIYDCNIYLTNRLHCLYSLIR